MCFLVPLKGLSCEKGCKLIQGNLSNVDCSFNSCTASQPSCRVTATSSLSLWSRGDSELSAICVITIGKGHFPTWDEGVGTRKGEQTPCYQKYFLFPSACVSFPSLHYQSLCLARSLRKGGFSTAACL